MSGSIKIERRDPITPVLKLGSVLSDVKRGLSSGLLEVKDREYVHEVSISEGMITRVSLDPGLRIEALSTDAENVTLNAKKLFSLPRPHVIWHPGTTVRGSFRATDPFNVVLSGITSRRSFFDPVKLVSRIPVETLEISREKQNFLRCVAFSCQEREFLARLDVPTPLSMALWKRGLPPAYAGALIVYLNLLGIWEGYWDPGVLPRSSTAIRIIKKMRSGSADEEILGLKPGCSAKEVDRSFKKLSLELHPDRTAFLPDTDLKLANTAYSQVCGAYERIARSRRSRPVLSNAVESVPFCEVKLVKKKADSWQELKRQAERFSSMGDSRRARAFAVKALAMKPPDFVRSELTTLISATA